ncbi:MAG: TIGR00282 family metallophosphoesterase [bacterium]|nr:TIGR00282 family metallophosphoesterase [bacterium]
MFRILFVGDVFGRPGRHALERCLKSIKNQYRIDFCIANGENAAGGRGLNQKVAKTLYEYGVDCITLGNHAWDNKNIFTFIDSDPRIVRAYNYPPNLPGRRFTTLEVRSGLHIVVAQLLGRVFMSHVDCPFRGAEEMLREIGPGKIIFCDVHGEATSEKVALGWFLDGKVTAVCGTHTHIPTADERILPMGTAYITDTGMTGAYDSIIGMNIESVTRQFVTSMKSPFKIALDNIKVSAVVITVDETTRKAVSIERILIPCGCGPCSAERRM